MKSKTIKLALLVASGSLLASCGGVNAFIMGGNIEDVNVQKVYKEAIENSEELESLEEPSSSEETSISESSSEEQTSIEETSSEETTEEESSSEEQTSTEEETSNEEESSEEEETPIEEVVTSYHFDYSYDFAVKASVNDIVLLDRSEHEKYSFTFVQTDDDIVIDMELAHSYVNSIYDYGEETIKAKYQDKTLYLDYDVSYGEFFNETGKAAYKINLDCLKDEFGDYFHSITDELLLGEDLTDSLSILETLITADELDAGRNEDGTILTVSYTKDGVATSMTFDLVNELVLHAKFDESAALLAYYEAMRKNDSLVIDTLESVTEINCSYNDSSLTKLTEEETAEYEVIGHGYGHYNDHGNCGEDEHEGGHHNHGNHEDWDEWDEEDWDYDWDEEDWDYEWDYDEDEGEEESETIEENDETEQPGHGHGDCDNPWGHGQENDDWGKGSHEGHGHHGR